MPLPRAVLWDMDGTLVNTEPYWIEVEFELAEKYDAPWSQEHALHLVGNDLLESGEYIREHMGIDLSPREVVEFLLDGVVERVRQEVPWRPGARELLADLRRHDVPCALVTMSWTRFAAPVVDRLPAGSFASVVTGDRVDHGKPHPAPYLLAAHELGVDPQECLAIEDSDTGARSAVAAGCTVLCVPNHVDIPEGKGRTLVPSLVGLSASALPRQVKP